MQIGERLTEVALPKGIDRPTLGPVATGVGEVFHYLMTSDSMNLTDLRTLHDWVVRPRLRQVSGVAEINPWGGLSKQFEVRADPIKLAKYKLTLDDLILALEENNQNTGGGYVVVAGGADLVQGIGRARNVKEIGGIVLTAVRGVPIRVRDVADVEIGHMIRRGAMTANGRGEVVLGLAFMRMGENSRVVTQELELALNEVRELLPPSVQITPVYQRSRLVDQVLETVSRNLFEGAILVIAVLFAFLGNLRAGLIVASAIPLSMLFAVTMMHQIGIAGSLMSLGAIDFGLVVDSSVVMVENCVRRLSHDRSGRSKLDVIRDAAIEVRKPTMFGELIIMIVYLPILTLQGVEGKLFRPMALTVVFALGASMLLSLTLLPVLASLGLSSKIREKETIIDRLAHWVFRPFFRISLRFPMLTLLLMVGITVGVSIMAMGIGSEFVPRLNEAAIVIATTRDPSISLEESVRFGTKIEQLLLREFPDEIENIWTRTGTPEVATDPMGMELSDVFITLKARSKWKKAKSQEELTEKMQRVTNTLPGMETLYTQPIEQRINEMIAGIKADVGAKLFGPDLNVLRAKADEIEKVIAAIPGASDVQAEQITGQPILTIEVDRQAASRHGIPVRKILEAVSAIGGINVGEILEPNRRFPLVVRLDPKYRNNPGDVSRILIPTVSGGRLPLTKLAKIEVKTGPSTIPREWGKRRIVIQSNVRGRDLRSFVEEAQKRVKQDVKLPPGYYVTWGGQFENLIRAERRLLLVVPVALVLIMSLLYLTFQSLRDAFMIFSGVFFARVGGQLGLMFMGLPFTISAGVGFIALAGASMLQGLVLVSAIRDRMAHGVPKREAIEQARLARLRPVLMTGMVAALGFVPMMLSTGLGAEIQRPLATVVVFGMIVNTFMTMLALPSLYLLFGKDISTTHVPTVSTNGTTVHSGASEIQPSLHD
jgi:cobalt-zinc-cadmium resistance protein CzcA